MADTVSVPFQGGPLDGTSADVSLPPAPVVSIPHMQMVGSETRTRLAQYDLWTFRGVGRNQYRYVFNSFVEIVMPEPVTRNAITVIGPADEVNITAVVKPSLPDITTDDLFGDDADSTDAASDLVEWPAHMAGEVSDPATAQVDISHVPPMRSGDSVSMTLTEAEDGSITIIDVVLAQEVDAETTLLTDIPTPDAEAVRAAKVRDARRRGGQRGS